MTIIIEKLRPEGRMIYIKYLKCILCSYKNADQSTNSAPKSVIVFVFSVKQHLKAIKSMKVISVLFIALRPRSLQNVIYEALRGLQTKPMTSGFVRFIVNRRLCRHFVSLCLQD